jgi:ATP-dependent Clp protease ATP-binding subunit ClpB
MTSNIGASYLLDGIRDDGSISEDAEKATMDDLRSHFRPEFLNRLDEIIMFKPLTKDNIGGIVDLVIDDLNKRLVDKELKIELREDAKDFIVDNGYDPAFGARPLKRYVQKTVETLVAKLILAGDLNTGDTIVIECDGSGLVAKRKI